MTHWTSVFCGFVLPLCFISFSNGAEKLSPRLEDGIAWYDLAATEIQGRGWKEMSPPFVRLPERFQDKVPAGVWRHSRNSSGLYVQFRTDATSIRVRHEVSGPLSMAHMTAVGTSGIDLYSRDDQNRWRWAGASMPEEKRYDQELLGGITPIMREYLLYFPLHNTTESLNVGVPEKAKFEFLPVNRKKSIVYYGTSIVHGGCASRPGMSVSAIIGRHFDRPVVNLGFSGSGRMEREMAEVLGEIDAAVYIVDCLPNMGIEEVSERAEPFLKRLRQLRPDTPIVLVEDRSFSHAWIRKGLLAEHQARRAALSAVYQKLENENVKNLYYLKADNLLGDDNEGTVDGSHLNDLGMFRMAQTLEAFLQKIPGLSTDSKTH